MWQIVHHASWVEQSTAQEGGTWTQKYDEVINSTTGMRAASGSLYCIDVTTTALTPFWSSTSGFWSSDAVRKPETFYYTYPILAGLDLSKPELARVQLLDRIAQELNFAGVFPLPPSDSSGPRSQSHLNVNEQFHDWRVHIRSSKFALRGSYSIFGTSTSYGCPSYVTDVRPVFLGTVPEDPKEWISSPSLVGVHDIFSRHAPEQCANCSRNLDRVVEGVIFLGPALRRLGMSTMKSDELVPYLKENLHWRVLKVSTASRLK